MYLRRWVILWSILAAGGLLAPSHPASASWGEQLNSVHFHSCEIDFGRVPRRGRVWEVDDRRVEDPGGSGERVGVELEEKDDRYYARDLNRERFTARAESLLLRQEWLSSRELFRYTLRRFGPDGTLRDRAQVLDRMLANGGSLSPHLRDLVLWYARLVPVTDRERPLHPERIGAGLARIAADPAAGFLREHALYQRACLAGEIGDLRKAVRLFREQVRLYPSSVKTEAGFIMLARSALLSPDPKLRNVAAGAAALDALDRRFMAGRFASAVPGLRARIHFLKGRYRPAAEMYLAQGDMYSVQLVRKAAGNSVVPDLLPRLMGGYLRRLGKAETLYLYGATLRHLEETRKQFSAADAKRFAAMLIQDLSLSAPYFYYRLYHTEASVREITHLGMLARRILRAHPKTRLPPLVLVRFAEVDYVRKKYDLAKGWAEYALRADHGRTEATPRALYVRGASLRKVGQLRQALADFGALLAEYPKSPLRRGAVEMQAILYEALGDLSGALDQYFELGYQADIAFFLDGRMSIAEVERYRRSRPNRTYKNVTIGGYYWSGGNQEPDAIPTELSTHSLIDYTLGVRYLRVGDYDRAARILRSIDRPTYRRFSRGRSQWEAPASPDPLTACRELGLLQRRVGAAKTGNERAAAMYRLASYLYRKGTLLFYVPPLWQGEREFHFEMYWNSKLASKDDERAMARYMKEHEIYSRALAIYEEIARRYPRSPYAPKALYRAACSSYHQANFNGWWRERDGRFGLQRKSSLLMARLARRYPKHPLAKDAAKFARVFYVARAGGGPADIEP